MGQISKSNSRILRVGILQNGVLLEEGLVRTSQSISLGPSVKNTFIVPAAESLPKTFTLFPHTPTTHGNGYELRFTAGMDGRIAIDAGAAPIALAELRPKAEKRGEIYSVRLGDGARGKISIGEVTVLFQLVEAPPKEARPRLPPSVRGALSQNLDWAMIAIVGASIVGHLFVALYLRTVDWPRTPDIEQIPTRIVQQFHPIPKIDVPKVDPNAVAVVSPKTKTVKTPRSPERTVAVAPHHLDLETQAHDAAARRADLAKHVANFGVLKVITSEGEVGSFTDMLKKGDAHGNADVAFAEMNHVSLAINGEKGGFHAHGSREGETVTTIKDLRVNAPVTVATDDRGIEKVAVFRGDLKTTAPLDIDGTLDPTAVIDTVRIGKRAILACYEKALRHSPNLAGKLQLRFTISTIGKVTATEIESDTLGDEEVGRCMTSIVRTWRFPSPDKAAVQFSYPFIFTNNK